MVDPLARRCELAAAYATGVLPEWLGTRLEARQREPLHWRASGLATGWRLGMRCNGGEDGGPVYIR